MFFCDDKMRMMNQESNGMLRGALTLILTDRNAEYQDMAQPSTNPMESQYCRGVRKKNQTSNPLLMFFQHQSNSMSDTETYNKNPRVRA